MKKIILVAFLLAALLACGSKPAEEVIEPPVVEIVEETEKTLKCADEEMTIYFYASSGSDEINSFKMIGVVGSLEEVGLTEEEFEYRKDEMIEAALDDFSGTGLTYTVELVDGDIIQTFFIVLDEADDFTKEYFYLDDLDTDINDIRLSLMLEGVSCAFE